MKRFVVFLIFLFSAVLSFPVHTATVNTSDTRMMSQAAVSDGSIAFIYAEDMWTAGIDGSNPRRLTIDEGVESNPHFSPDGKTIAFSAQYDGNTDVFIVPSEGGVPVRLTWHPGNDLVRGFTPDGKAVLFASPRENFSGRHYQLFTVPLEGGYPKKLDIPNAWTASYSPDGNYLAYTPLSPQYTQWKNYRGGTISTIWIFSFADNSVIKIPQPEGGCNDADPMWKGNNIYFLSDRNGEFNLYSWNTTSEELKQLTFHNDFPVLTASSSNDNIIYEQAGYLHLYNINQSHAKKISLGIATDLTELRTRYVEGSSYIRSADISPTGARVVFDFRGDIISLPAEKGDPRNLTLTTHSHEKYPAWSPDGRTIAYFSDASGEYMLYLKNQDGKGEERKLGLTGTGFYAYPVWSPDSKKICFVDNGRNVYIIDINTGVINRIDSDEIYAPGAFRDIKCNWSSDSKWLAYTKYKETNFSVIYIYSLDQQKSFPLTDGMSDATDPVFDPEGKYIYFFASTNAGPVVNWFDLSSADMRMTSSIYLATLGKDIESPFMKESDEEKTKDEEASSIEEKEVKQGRRKKEEDSPEEEKNDAVKIDTDGLMDRIVSFPLRAGSYSSLKAGEAGIIFYIARPGSQSSSATLHKYSLKERKDEEVMELDDYFVSADKKKMLYRKGETFGITDSGKKPEPGKGVLNTSSVSVKIDPLHEWPQIFDEAWRLNRDYFYDPGMHGADWKAMKEKYSVFLPHLTCRSDLYRVIQWMCSELSVGHHRYSSPGERPLKPESIGIGLLGADYKVSDNRYMISRIYGGLNWNPDLRSPLTEPGLNITVGTYILSVNGHEVTADKNLFSFFEKTDGKIVELTVNTKPSFDGARTVRVVPVNNELSLRNRAWVEGNLKRVTEATNGEVAYVYVPNTSELGHEYFKRYFFPQANRKAIIIDERFNGGGLVADYYMDILQRPLQAYWNFRYGKDIKTPTASIQGPKVMIIDENAGSGGDLLPWMFRKFNAGTIVGKRTWGGLVGTLGFPEFMDGGSVTAPNLAIWTNEGFIVENRGVEPDIEVEQWPADIIQGKDPQLEKAIEVALKELKENPPEEPVRPPYPVRVKK